MNNLSYYGNNKVKTPLIFNDASLNQSSAKVSHNKKAPLAEITNSFFKDQIMYHKESQNVAATKNSELKRSPTKSVPKSTATQISKTKVFSSSVGTPITDYLYQLSFPVYASKLRKPNESILFESTPASFSWNGTKETIKNFVSECLTDSVKLVFEDSIINDLYQVALYGNDLELVQSTKRKFLLYLISKDPTHIRKISLNRSIYDKASKNQNANENLTGQLQKVTEFFNISLIIAESSDLFNSSIGRSNSSHYYVYLIGPEENVSCSSLRCRLIIDDLKGLFIDSVNIELSLINLIGGFNLTNLQDIIKQTGVFLYVPELLKYTSKFSDNSQLFISSSQQSQVLLAKFLLNSLNKKVLKSIYYKDIRVPKAKLQIMMHSMQSKINQIMYHNGSFIQFPEMNSESDIVRVQSSSKYLVNKTLKDISSLSSDIYELKIKGANSSNYQIKIFESAKKNNCSIFTHSQNSNKIYGSKDSIKSVLLIFKSDYSSINFSTGSINDQLLKLTQNVNQNTIEYSISIEVPNVEKDFICGKKNGKLIKIMNQTGIQFSFLSLNEYNFIAEFSSKSFDSINKGLNLFELELPSEISFYIPEIYHRQIIGVGGNLIQMIMRKYNVFIKLSNNFEMKQHFLGLARYENVLIKCPNKNSINIPRAKAELEQLVNTCKKEQNYITFQFSQNQYKLFLDGMNTTLVSDIEKSCNCYIEFQNFSNSNNEFYGNVEIRGIDLKSCIEGFKNLSRNFAKECRISIACPNYTTLKVTDIISNSNEEFISKIVAPLKIFLNMDVKVIHHCIVLTCEKENLFKIAVNSLNDFLKDCDTKISNIEYVQLAYKIIDHHHLKAQNSIVATPTLLNEGFQFNNNTPQTLTRKNIMNTLTATPNSYANTITTAFTPNNRISPREMTFSQKQILYDQTGIKDLSFTGTNIAAFQNSIILNSSLDRQKDSSLTNSLPLKKKARNITPGMQTLVPLSPLECSVPQFPVDDKHNGNFSNSETKKEQLLPALNMNKLK